MSSVLNIGSFGLSFQNEHIIQENEVRCIVRESDFNLSYNPTLLKYGSPYITNIKQEFIPGGSQISNQGDDIMTSDVPIGFNFEFYGASYSSCNISSNGNLQFSSSNSDFIPTSLSASFFGPTIFAFWTDLTTNGSRTDKGIYTQTIGTPGNRIFTAEWKVNYLSSSKLVDFQIRLYEGSNKIEIIYGNIENNNANITIGIQNENNSYVAYNNASKIIPPNLTTLVFTPSSDTSTYTLTNYDLTSAILTLTGSNDNTLKDFTTGSFFQPYVTTIGLYNDDNDLLMVAKLAKPIVLSSDTDMTFIVKYDT